MHKTTSWNDRDREVLDFLLRTKCAAVVMGDPGPVAVPTPAPSNAEVERLSSEWNAYVRACMVDPRKP